MATPTPTYTRAVTVAALQAVINSAWIAARELSPAKRRLARLGMVAVGVTGYTAATPGTREAMREVRADIATLRQEVEAAGDQAEPTASEPAVTEPAVTEPADKPAGDEPAATPEFDKRRAVAIVGALGLTLAVTLGRRRLQKRWLARLAQDGHPYPARALALRMAPVVFATELAIQLVEMHTPSLKPDGDSES